MGFNKPKNNKKQSHDEVDNKKPFNKKKWREQKYSNKAQVKRWDNIKRKQALREYSKELKKSGVNLSSKELHSKLDKNRHVSTFKQAQLQCEKIKKEKEEKIKEQERIRKERAEALKAYKEKKIMRFKKLSGKTKKGQPLMRGRIELLLEKIQKEYGNQ